MRCSTYIYGRTLKIDFREICSPTGGISAESQMLIEQLINTDVISNGDINRLRYLFVRERNQVIFGIGFNHRQYLDKSLWTDLTGRRGLRSFVGIVIDNEEFNNLESIPVNDEFFIDLYLKNISSVWDLEDRPKNRTVIVSDPEIFEPLDFWYKLDGKEEFNSDERYCRFFSPTEESSVIHSLKNCLSSMAIGLNVESHVISAFRKFGVRIPNAICLDTQIKHDFELYDKKQEEREPIKSQNIKAKNTSQRILRHDDRKSNQITETGVNGPVSKPAILSNLKKYDSDENDNEEKKQLQENDLMSIDWGDENKQISDEVSSDTSESGKSDELFVEDKGGIVEDSQEMTHVEMDFKRSGSNDNPKKVYRPMMIIVIVAAFIILLAIALCSRENKNSNPSPSGGKESKKEMKMKRNQNLYSFMTLEHFLKGIKIQ